MIIVRILMGLINAILHVFVSALTLLFSTLLTGILVGVVVLGVVLLTISGTVGFGIFRRFRK